MVEEFGIGLKILWEKYGYENWSHKKYIKSFKIFYIVIRVKHRGSVIYKKE